MLVALWWLISWCAKTNKHLTPVGRSAVVVVVSQVMKMPYTSGILRLLVLHGYHIRLVHYIRGLVESPLALSNNLLLDDEPRVVCLTRSILSFLQRR